MTIDPIEMAAESVRRQFGRQIDEANFPFVQGLRELANFFRQCREASSSDRVGVAFALEKIAQGSSVPTGRSSRQGV